MLAKVFAQWPSRLGRIQLVLVACLLCLSMGCGGGDEVAENTPSSADGTGGETEPSDSEETANDSSSTTDGDDAPTQSGAVEHGTEMSNKMEMDADSIIFKDSVESNVEIPSNVADLVFTKTNGDEVKLADLVGRKNLVLVFTEGFSGMLCPFCTTQTSRLVANYEEFQSLNAEVIVVYPGDREHIEEFVDVARTSGSHQLDQVPFDIVLDQDLTAVSFFGIESNLAHPSTFILDVNGNVQLAYVGADMSADRPSISAMLDVIRQANQ